MISATRTKLTPLIKMFTLGHGFIPPGIHAGGLRYHGMSPLVSLAAKLGLIEAVAFHQIECFEAARLFACTEGIIPAPESSHAIRAAIVEASRCKETGRKSASSSTSAATAFATWAPTTASSAVNSKTSSIPRR